MADREKDEKRSRFWNPKTGDKIRGTMKVIKENAKNRPKGLNNDIFWVAEKIGVFLYLFCMLGIFPLYYRDHYYKIGDAKYEFFWKTTLLFLAFQGILLLARKICKWRTGRKKEGDFFSFLETLSGMDFAVFVYGICVGISYLFSDYKEYAFKGAVGWEMGLCSQILFLALYFILSRQKEIPTMILWVHLAASFFVYGFGILHRFEVDPLGMYEGLDLEQKIEFLSTIGQATWFSSYVCTTFAIGMFGFYISKKPWVRTVTGMYSIVSFAVLVIQNSDSAFIAIAGILLLLGYFSLEKMELWCRFWQLLCLLWGTFAGIGLLQTIFADRIVPLDSLSLFFSQSIFTWMLFLMSLVIFLYFTKERKKKAEETKKIMHLIKRIYQGILLLLGLAAVLIFVFIFLNTKGYLFRWLGYQNTNQYLLFDAYWGNSRGYIWTVVWQAWREMPFLQKLFGVGPDSLSAYLYSFSGYEELIYKYFGALRLTNAHNEYLNSLVCYGVVGVTAWLGVLIGGIVYFYRKAKEDSRMIVFSLCIMGYACHNIFCYQQVCCTPFLFLFLGLGESLTKSQNFNTIK